ncbi:MAG: redoxin domain-containing protein [Acidimicrobiia bacterium]|jgi:peroxiredoxin
MVAEVGSRAPEFELRDQNWETRTLSDLAGSKAMVVFIPWAFTRTCQAELCTLRDNFSSLEARGVKVAVITCDSVASNRRWAKDQGFTFPILSDHWPHGATAQAYGCFNPVLGVAMRSTYVLDPEGVVTEVIATDQIDQVRDFNEYERALA